MAASWTVAASWLTISVMIAPFAVLGAGSATVVAESWSGGAHPFLVVPAGVHPSSVTCSGSGICVGALRTAYNYTGILTNGQRNGSGQTVVIVDACGDKKIASDLATFDSVMGLPNPKLTVVAGTGGAVCSNSGWALETALDVEWSHAVAPGAAIALVEANSASFKSLFSAWSYALSHSLGNQISNSWGGYASCSSSAVNLLTKANTAHVTVLASAGDSGAWGSGFTANAQSPADCLNILTIGGTSLTLGSGNSYGGETAWSGSGGGYVPSSKEPGYQTTTKISDSYAELGEPTVSAVADPSTGVWVYDAGYGGWVVVGGTSVACPIWAGTMADVNSLRAANGFVPAGVVNSYLFLHVYGVSGGSSNYSLDLHDVTSGSNGWSAGSGWDAVTGLGSMNAYAIVQQLGSDSSA